MKVWAQDEFDLFKTGADGQYRLGKGDFRRVNMRGYTRLILGAGSLLGAANIGANSEIGAHCDFDAGAVIGHGSIIGARCHFGKGAWIKSGCIVGNGVCFGDGAVIERGVELEGGVELPAKVELFGVKNADGRTMLTIAPVIGGTLHAFRADGRAYVSLPGQLRRLEEFAEYAADQVAYAEFSGMKRDRGEARELLDAANYIAARLCAG
jgi:carbonic anhydrase/acetyltransferase-like protein (isoleucine patch superfamily)|nr:MAG TPA: hypothetical protein [Caudoviricetes sp.]